jgi:hypothetical protein
MAIGSVAIMLIIGGRLVGGGDDGRTQIFTGADVEIAPPLSVATAVSAQIPTGALLQTRE